MIKLWLPGAGRVATTRSTWLAAVVLICSEARPDLQVAVMEVHGVRAQLREGGGDPALAVSDAVYMKHFSALLDEWLDQAPFE